MLGPPNPFGFPFGSFLPQTRGPDPFSSLNAMKQRIASFRPYQGPQYRAEQPRLPSPPMFGADPGANAMSRGLGILGNAMRNAPYEQWSPTNDAARLIDSGEYADPLLRKAATWDAPSFGPFRLFGL